MVEVVKEQILAPDTENLLSAPPEDLDALLKSIEHHVNTINNLIVRGTHGRRWASEFARMYVLTRRVRDKLSSLDTILSVTQEAYTVLMVEQMEAEGTASLRLADGQPVSTYPEPYATVHDRDAFHEWCIAQGLGRQMQLPWQTTNMLVKNMLVAGEAEPPGVTVFSKVKIRMGAGGD